MNDIMFSLAIIFSMIVFYSVLYWEIQSVKSKLEEILEEIKKGG